MAMCICRAQRVPPNANRSVSPKRCPNSHGQDCRCSVLSGCAASTKGAYLLVVACYNIGNKIQYPTLYHSTIAMCIQTHVQLCAHNQICLSAATLAGRQHPHAFTATLTTHNTIVQSLEETQNLTSPILQANTLPPHSLACYPFVFIRQVQPIRPSSVHRQPGTKYQHLWLLALPASLLSTACRWRSNSCHL